MALATNVSTLAKGSHSHDFVDLATSGFVLLSYARGPVPPLQRQVYATLGGAGSLLAQAGPPKSPKALFQHRKQRLTEATEHRPHEARKQRPGARKNKEKKARGSQTKNGPEMLSEQLPRCFQGPEHY